MEQTQSDFARNKGRKGSHIPNSNVSEKHRSCLTFIKKCLFFSPGSTLSVDGGWGLAKYPSSHAGRIFPQSTEPQNNSVSDIIQNCGTCVIPLCNQWLHMRGPKQSSVAGVSSNDTVAPRTDDPASYHLEYYIILRTS